MAEQIRATPRLSKSRFQNGCQCALRLCYDVNEPDLAEEFTEEQQARFDTGHEVGELAQRRYPGGKLITADYQHPKQALEQTTDALSEAFLPAIYEAAFEFRNVFARADILVRAEKDTWDLIEVKSSANSKDHFRRDVAVQYWIARNSGLKIRKAGLLLLNRDYVYDGKKLDLDDLFAFHDLTNECASRLDEIGEKVGELQKMLAAEEAPQIKPGEQCVEPYDCPYYGHCTKGMEFSEQPLDTLYKLHPVRRAELESVGIKEIREIPEDFALNEIQARQRRCVIEGRPWGSERLPELLRRVRYPAHHLDFETVLPAIPLHKGTRPFDQVPFQFSCHHQESDGGQILHSEFLAQDRSDPREPLAEALLTAVGKRGAIFTYTYFEARIINDLAAAIPSLARDLKALLDRLVDLAAIIRNHYYHPGFKGSFSIKTVLPVLIPQMTYEGMEVSDGMMAGAAWMQMLETEDATERARMDAALRAYCRQDTLAIVRLREVLGQ